MVKHTQTIHQLLPTNCLSVFDHFVGLALKGLNLILAVLVMLNKFVGKLNFFVNSDT